MVFIGNIFEKIHFVKSILNCYLIDAYSAW